MKKESEMILRLNTRSFILALSLTASLVFLVSIAGQVFRYSLRVGQFPALINEFYIDAESNIPTFFSSVILLITSIFLGVVYDHKRTSRDAFRFHWLILGAAFLFLAVDESTLIYHELLSGIVADSMTSMNQIFVGITAVLFVLLFSYQYLKFFLHLPVRYRLLFAVCAALYLSGAVGMDYIGTQYHEVHGKYNLSYSMLATIEKMLEVGGIILLIHTLSLYMSDMIGAGQLKEASPDYSQKVLRYKDHSETT